MLFYGGKNPNYFIFIEINVLQNQNSATVYIVYLSCVFLVFRITIYCICAKSNLHTGCTLVKIESKYHTFSSQVTLNFQNVGFVLFLNMCF